jgi:hypothetical protein
VIGYEQLPRLAAVVRAVTGEEEIVPPGITLETDRPEYLWLGDTYLAGGQFDATSAAGTLPEALLFNPPASQPGLPGSLVVLTSLRFALHTLAGNVFLRVFRGGAPPAGFVDVSTGPLDTRDSRLIAARSTNGRLMQATNAAADGGVAFDFIVPQLDVVYEDRSPIVLGPGTGLIINKGGVGVARLEGRMRWYERGLRQEELQQ